MEPQSRVGSRHHRPDSVQVRDVSHGPLGIGHSAHSAVGRRNAPGASGGTAGRRGGTGATRRYAAPSGGRGSASPRFGQQREGPLGQRGDRQRRVHAEVRRHRRPVRHVQPFVPVDALVRVEHALPRVAPIGQPPRKCAVIGTSARSPTVPPGVARHAGPLLQARRDPPDGDMAHRDPAGVRRPVPLAGVEPPAGQPDGPSRRGTADTVIELSSDCMTRPMTDRSEARRTENDRAKPSGSRATTPGRRRQRPRLLPRNPRSSRRRARSRAAPIEFEPRPYLTFSTWVSASGWKEAVMATPRVRSSAGTCAVMAPSTDSELVRVTRSEPGRQPRQHAVRPQRLQQTRGPPGAGGDDDLPRGHGPHVATASGRQRPARADRRHQPPPARVPGVPRLQSDDGPQRLDPDAEPLGERQVVLDQGVLGTVAAADHAVAALDAAGASRPGAPEEGVGHANPGLALPVASEEHPDRRLAEGVPHPEVVGDLAHDLLDRALARVDDHAEHPGRLVVVRRQLRLPVGDRAPLRVVKNGAGGT